MSFGESSSSMGILVIFDCGENITINTFEPSLLSLFWIVSFEWIPRSKATVANQTDYWGGRNNFIGFKRTCRRLMEDSIPQGRLEGAGIWAWAWGVWGVRALISELWLPKELSSWWYIFWWVLLLTENTPSLVLEHRMPDILKDPLLTPEGQSTGNPW